MKYIEKLKNNWNAFAENDPMWAILSYQEKMGNKWQLGEFLETGMVEINSVLMYINSVKGDTPRRRALDFGCGIGRLSQAMALYFDEVYGIDISPKMIELANKYNIRESKCKYFMNDTDDLSLFSGNSFDFIYSNIVLQHMKPDYSKKYIKEFLRVLAPRGLLIFQLPSERITLKGKLYRSFLLDIYHSRLKKIPVMEMHCIQKNKMIKFLQNNGATIVDVIQDKSSTSGAPHFVSFRYCVTKD
jgi:ubiquinone/menaquinone biosynthesis C-methylase UbiE